MNLIFVAFVFSVSFGMAYDFIDSVGNDVDVVSDSEVSVLFATIIGMFMLGICSLLYSAVWKNYWWNKLQHSDYWAPFLLK